MTYKLGFCIRELCDFSEPRKLLVARASSWNIGVFSSRGVTRTSVLTAKCRNPPLLQTSLLLCNVGTTAEPLYCGKINGSCYFTTFMTSLALDT
ncbi:hypothetical protein J6590_007625 [Homalodisca vitripennis]|nr:hypothetical protein J6590_007625 [Homalodisca vitripennis]